MFMSHWHIKLEWGAHSNGTPGSVSQKLFPFRDHFLHADPLCCTGTDPTETSAGSCLATKPESFNDPLPGPHRNGSRTDPLQSRSRNGPVSEPNMDAFRDSKRIRFGSQRGLNRVPRGSRKGTHRDPEWALCGSQRDAAGTPVESHC